MSKDRTRIQVHVQPNARRNEILGFREGLLWLRIAASPVEGKANRELVDYLSEILGVSKSSVEVERGTTGRHKTVAVEGISLERALLLINEAASS